MERYKSVLDAQNTIQRALISVYGSITTNRHDLNLQSRKNESAINKVSGCWKKHPDAVKEYPDALKGHPDAFIFQFQKRRTERWKIY